MTSRNLRLVNRLLLKKASDLDMSALESFKLRWNLRKLRRKLTQYEIHPQGSLVMGTAVSATYTKDRYDLDALIIIRHDSLSTTPRSTRKKLQNDIRDSHLSGVLTKLDEGTRCWRLTHRIGSLQLDLTPAVEDDSPEPGAVLITHKSKQDWTRSNPTAMAKWFYNRLRDDWQARPIIWFALRQMRAKALPFWPYKVQLQGLIKILKVHRNVYFSKLVQNDRLYRPSSIIVTVLAVTAYSGRHSSFLDSLKATVKTMRQILEAQNSQYVVISNPIDHSSNLAERWTGDPQWHDNCCRWLRRLEGDLEHLNHMNISDARKVIDDILTERPRLELTPLTPPMLITPLKKPSPPTQSPARPSSSRPPKPPSSRRPRPTATPQSTHRQTVTPPPPPPRPPTTPRKTPRAAAPPPPSPPIIRENTPSQPSAPLPPPPEPSSPVRARTNPPPPPPQIFAAEKTPPRPALSQRTVPPHIKSPSPEPPSIPQTTPPHPSCPLPSQPAGRKAWSPTAATDPNAIDPRPNNFDLTKPHRTELYPVEPDLAEPELTDPDTTEPNLAELELTDPEPEPERTFTLQSLSPPEGAVPESLRQLNKALNEALLETGQFAPRMPAPEHSSPELGFSIF